MPNQHTGPVPIGPRFWSKVNKSDDCWMWTAGIGTDGYGKFWINGRTIHASRMVYILTHGEISDKLLVLHHCDNPVCVRPDHLYLGTHADNSADMVRKGRVATGERHGMSKLTAKAVLAIRSKAAMGATRDSLAYQYDVTSAYIWAIVHRKTWRHI